VKKTNLQVAMHKDSLIIIFDLKFPCHHELQIKGDYAASACSEREK
jgi:hypothetical protein